MVVTLAIGLVLVCVALPMMVGAIQAYRLNSIAQQTANLIELTRYTAIRHNIVTSVQRTVQNGSTIFYLDLNGNGTLDAGEPMVLLPSDMQVANGQLLTPDGTKTGLNPIQDFAGSITFDYRGTASFAGGLAPSVNFLALGYTNQAQYGSRAITVTPMGQTKIWKAQNGSWVGM
jgi:Tfp pilus assembly protein FimT